MTKDTEDKLSGDKVVDEQASDDPLIQGFKKRTLSQAEALQFLQQNKGRLEKSLSSIDKRDVLSKITVFVMAIFSRLAGWIDVLKRGFVTLLMKVPAPEIIKQSLHTASVVTNFKGMVDFIRTKYYAFKQSPYNEKLVQHMD